MAITSKEESHDTDEGSGDALAGDVRDPSPLANAPAGQGGSGDSGVRSMGVERYVLVGYIAIALVFFLIIDRVGTMIWNKYAEPNAVMMTLIALAAAGVLAVGLYKQPAVNTFSNEVAQELAKVTWPTRKETYAATIVVIVTSIVAAVYLGLLDAMWSALTDLIYTL